MTLWGCALLGYACGAFPSSYLVGRLFFGLNLSEHGSKNLGATNALRVLGRKAGVAVLFCDILKGFLPVAYLNSHQTEPFEPLLAGIFAILGHSFSVFVRFKGGKGVATSAGVFLALAPIAMAITFLVFAVTVYATRYISLGSILAAITLPLALVFKEGSFGWLQGASVLVAIFVIFKHRSNIGRLYRGEENKFVWKAKYAS